MFTVAVFKLNYVWKAYETDVNLSNLQIHTSSDV